MIGATGPDATGPNAIGPKVPGDPDIQTACKQIIMQK